MAALPGMPRVRRGMKDVLAAELFAEIGLNIKDTKIFPFIGIVGYCNDYIGYVGTAPVYAKGGYEMMMMSGSGQAGEILQNAAVRLLNALK
jgi:hypothetical protein